MTRDNSEEFWTMFFLQNEDLSTFTQKFTVKKFVHEKKGVFYFGDLRLIPFNHWLKDTEWSVLIFEEDFAVHAMQVTAISHEEAIVEAIEMYNQLKDEDD